MKALLLSEYRKLEIAELSTPVPDIGEVLVCVAACGICGSDVHGYDGSSGRRIPPIVMGHEAAGIVVSVGAGVANCSPGDRVTFDSTISCGECGPCRRGDINLCDRRQVLGVSCSEYRRNGAFAEYVTVPSRIVYRLPDSLSFPEAAMLEAVSVALHAVSLAEIVSDYTALVVGAGMIGLLSLQALRAVGCSRVLVADLDPSRLKLAEQLGAAEVLNAGDPDLMQQILQVSGGRGVDIAIEAVGKPETWHWAVDMVRRGGTVNFFGGCPNESRVSLDTSLLHYSEITCKASFHHTPAHIRKALDIVGNGDISAKDFVNRQEPLTNLLEVMRHLMSHNGHLKTAIIP